ncbi:MAG: Gfo/Idh/MocA family protein [Armatimonadota bacterium]
MLRVGVVGRGSMGLRLARNCNELEDAEVEAVYDIDEGSASRAASEFGARVCNSYQELIGSNVDAVIVATPNDFHAPISTAAAQAGKHVFCEKPMALTVADCRAIIEAAEKANVKLMVGHVLRLIPVFWKTKQIVDSGVLGNPFVISVTRLGGPDTLASGWRATVKHSGGYLYEINVHELDYMRHIMGDAEMVFASTGHFTQALVEFEDVAFVHIRYKKRRIRNPAQWWILQY